MPLEYLHLENNFPVYRYSYSGSDLGIPQLTARMRCPTFSYTPEEILDTLKKTCPLIEWEMIIDSPRPGEASIRGNMIINGKNCHCHYVCGYPKTTVDLDALTRNLVKALCEAILEWRP